MWEEGEEGEDGTNSRGDEDTGRLKMGARHKLELDRIRSKLVSLRDVVLTGYKALQTRFVRTEGLDLEDPERSEFHPSQQQWRRNVEESEPEETCYSWTIHSPDGCGMEEVLRGGGAERV